MNRPINFRAVLAPAVLLLASARLQAQAAATNLPPPPPSPNYQYQQVGPGVTLHQLSPVVYFRGILGMTPAERDRALAGKSADYKKAILDKVQEYQALPPDIREARLRQTQLRWNLITLMKLPPAGRPALLKDLAAQDRIPIEERLRQWDQLPADLQTAFLEKESFLDFYLRWLDSSAAEKQEILGNLPPARRQDWTNELARWQTLPDTQRQQLCDQFRQFFELNPEDQNRTLTTFSDTERKDMEAALNHFAVLTAAQRKACVDSFQKFATMGPEERNQFLKNAASWEAMTAQERDLWRALVQKFPIMPPMPIRPGTPQYPPLPPGMKITPPLPPGMKLPAPSAPPSLGDALPPGKSAALTNAAR
jgi:predicted Fe-S protein YdhL (DUF1289 family)